MSNSLLQQARELFDRCLEHPAGEWNAVLAGTCDDPELRERVRRMLDHHTDTAVQESGFMRLEAADPEQIGPYRVLQRLGEGGMGIVYAAEQRAPVRRRVAIKVLRSGQNSREVLARFDVERQALALMSHVNIARILDAGTTADRRPFIVMEFVPGEAITRYCERRDLPLRDRLELFREVCDAVQHAHQRGVIHRDIKPSNILIMEEDGRAIPKVIDFGIAKAITQRLTEQTLETRVGSLLGTPDYMSPEQANLSPLDVDTRADVYALGAVLYQLLTGVPPLELSGSGKNYLEMQQEILARVPPPPSSRVGGPLQRRIRGELDWITGKALEKQRNMRYASPADLANDVRNHLAGSTVIAGPPSQMRRIGKFARRHWLATVSIATVAVTLGVSQALLLHKNRELQTERDRASSESQASERVTEFLLNTFQASDPGNADAGQVTARELLDRARQEIETDESLTPPVRLRLFAGLGNAYSRLGRHEIGIELLQQADTLAAIHATPERRFAILSRLGLVHGFERNTEASQRVLNQALRIAEAAGINDLERLFDMRRSLATIERDSGNVQAARDMLVALLDDARDAFGAGDERTLDAAARLVYVHSQLAEFDTARELTEAMLPVARDALRADHPLVSYLLGNLAAVYMALEQWDKAHAINRDIHASFMKQFGPDGGPTQTATLGLAITHPDRLEGLRLLEDLAARQRAQYGEDAAQLIETLQDIGWLHSKIPGNEQQARTYYERALALGIHHLGEEHMALESIHYGMAMIEAAAGNTAESLEHFRKASVSRSLQYSAARDPQFANLRNDPEFISLLGDFAAGEADE